MRVAYLRSHLTNKMQLRRSAPRILTVWIAALPFGAGWGALAAGVFLAMFTGYAPAPGNAAPPVSVVLTLLYAPFLGAIGLEAIAQRNSVGLEEVLVLTVVVGILAGGAIGFALRLARSVVAKRAPE